MSLRWVLKEGDEGKSPTSSSCIWSADLPDSVETLQAEEGFCNKTFVSLFHFEELRVLFFYDSYCISTTIIKPLVSIYFCKSHSSSLK